MTAPGWMSDRTVCYLASGRPCIVQATGAECHLPRSLGLQFFHTKAEAVEALRAVECDYEHAAHEARRLAEDIFATDVIIPQLINILRPVYRSSIDSVARPASLHGTEWPPSGQPLQRRLHPRRTALHPEDAVRRNRKSRTDDNTDRLNFRLMPLPRLRERFGKVVQRQDRSRFRAAGVRSFTTAQGSMWRATRLPAPAAALAAHQPNASDGAKTTARNTVASALIPGVTPMRTLE